MITRAQARRVFSRAKMPYRYHEKAREITKQKNIALAKALGLPSKYEEDENND